MRLGLSLQIDNGAGVLPVSSAPNGIICWSTDDLIWGASNTLTWLLSSGIIYWSTDDLIWDTSNTLTWS